MYYCAGGYFIVIGALQTSIVLYCVVLFAIRHTRQKENTILRNRAAASLLEDGERNFWQEIKGIAVSSRMVDGLICRRR